MDAKKLLKKHLDLLIPKGQYLSDKQIDQLRYEASINALNEVIESSKTEKIEFAKTHVDAALKAAVANGTLDFVPHDQEYWTQKSIERQDILDFYDENTSDEDFAYEELRNRDGFTIEINEDSILNAYFIQ
jgi:hypothetical protein